MNTATDAYYEATLPQGTIRYRDEGTGPTLVFVHGLLVNSVLWRKVIAELSTKFRCIALDLPLGAHSIPMKDDAAIGPLGVAQLIADFLEALDLQDVTLVGNDTGGAMCQLTITHHPERIARLVLTNCDAFEAFFPPLIMPFAYGARLFDIGFAHFLAWTFRTHRAQRMLMAVVSHSHANDAILDAYFAPLLSGDKGIRRDVTRFLKQVSNRYTLEAAKKFQDFQRPVSILWGRSDFIFSASIAKRLQQAFPHATLEFVAQSRAFVPEDQPVVLAQKIAEFVGETGEFRSDRRTSSESTPELAGGTVTSSGSAAETE